MYKKLIVWVVLFVATMLLISPSPSFAIYEEGSQPEYTDDMMYSTGIVDEEPVLLDTDENENLIDYDFSSRGEDELFTTTDQELTDEELEALGALGALIGVTAVAFGAIVGFFSYFLFSLLLMIAVKKLNMPNSWLAWVPFYQIYLFNKAADERAWKILLLLIPFVNIWYTIVLIVRINNRIKAMRSANTVTPVTPETPVAPDNGGTM